MTTTTTTSRATNGRKKGSSSRSTAESQSAQSDLDMVVAGVVAGIKEQCVQRPYTTLGVSATLGYVLGGGLPRIMTRAVVVAGARYAISKVLRDALAEYSARANS